MLIPRRNGGASAERTPLRLAAAQPENAFAMSFDDREIEALPGQTVAAALWQAGIASWRRTRGSGAPRGVFCGVGICFDCLVIVNDRPNQRACIVPARPGDVVRTQDGTGHGDRSGGGEGRGGG
jgi:hypothetical protein